MTVKSNNYTTTTWNWLHIIKRTFTENCHWFNWFVLTKESQWSTIKILIPQITIMFEKCMHEKCLWQMAINQSVRTLWNNLWILCLMQCYLLYSEASIKIQIIQLVNFSMAVIHRCLKVIKNPIQQEHRIEFEIMDAII